MSRLITLTALFLTGILTFGLLALGYTRASAGPEGPQSFAAYVTGLTAMVLPASAPPGDLPPRQPSQALLAMLPQSAPGWTPRAVADADAALWPGIDPDHALLAPHPRADVTDARLAYDGAAGTVVFALTRYPDDIFTAMFSNEKFGLRDASLAPDGTEFLTTRGLVIREARRSDPPGPRLFLAQVGKQTHLRVLAPAGSVDRDLLPLFQALDVAAIAADTVAPEDGIGQGPEVLASDLVAAAAVAEAARRAENKAKLEAELAALAKPAAKPAASDPADDATVAAKGTKGLDGGGMTCREVAGRKVCSATDG